MESDMTLSGCLQSVPGMTLCDPSTAGKLPQQKRCNVEIAVAGSKGCCPNALYFSLEDCLNITLLKLNG
jgi:hypothetical protein